MSSMEFIPKGGVAFEQVRLPICIALNGPVVALNFFDLQLIFF